MRSFINALCHIRPFEDFRNLNVTRNENEFDGPVWENLLSLSIKPHVYMFEWLQSRLDVALSHKQELSNTSLLLVISDVGSWREGGGRNLNSASSPPEMDAKPQEEGSTSLGTSTPPAEAEEPGRNAASDAQREKRDARERFPPTAASQPKLNGGQQPPAGVPTHFDPAFRSMMPPYVSLVWQRRQ